MSWERDPLWAKARLYIERAFNARHDDELFGLWCSFGLELLARASIASISPTLLAEPANDHKHLLHALNRGSEKIPKKSLAISQVLVLCKTLIDDFTEKHHLAAAALINRRNVELHSGTAAFSEYTPEKWIGGFYRLCKILAESMGESLESLLGEEDAKAAIVMLEEIDNDLKQKVLSKISSHKNVFSERSSEDQEAAIKQTAEAAEKLAYQGHHRVKCPACDCTATLQGEAIGRGQTQMTDDKIILRQPISPRSFSCPGCGLKFSSYAELEAAGLGGHYTRTTTFTPEDYYNLVDLDNYDLKDDLIAFLEENPEIAEGYYGIQDMREHDNE